MEELLASLVVPAVGVIINLGAKVLAVDRADLKYEDLAGGIDLAAGAAVAVPTIAVARGAEATEAAPAPFLVALLFLFGTLLYEKFVGRPVRQEKKIAQQRELATFFWGVVLPAGIGGTALAVVVSFGTG
jgi:hypothetical protein